MSLSIISDEEVLEHLPSSLDLIGLIENALSRFSKTNESHLVNPLRNFIKGIKHPSVLYTMPCYVLPEDVYCVKIISIGLSEDPEPASVVTCLINLFSGRSGVPLLMMDGESLTMKRTAAASAVATKYLASKDPKVLTFMGSGRLARSHFQALSAIFNFREVRVWNHRSASGLTFVEELKSAGVNCVWVDRAQEAVAEADVVCVVTASHTPVLDVEWLKEGAHVNAVGACQATAQEIFPATIHQAIIYVDSVEGAKTEAGDIIQSRAEIYAEVGEVINGEKTAFREKKTIFKSLGIAIEDALTAFAVYQSHHDKKKKKNYDKLN